LSTADPAPDSLVVLNNVLYAGSQLGKSVRAMDGSTLASTGTAPVASPYLMATDGTQLWMSTTNGAGILHYVPGGGASKQQAADVGKGIAASSAGACWAAPAASVVRCFIGGVITEDLTEPAGGQTSVAMNAENVFFSDTAGNVKTGNVHGTPATRPI